MRKSQSRNFKFFKIIFTKLKFRIFQIFICKLRSRNFGFSKNYKFRSRNFWNSFKQFANFGCENCTLLENVQNLVVEFLIFSKKWKITINYRNLWIIFLEKIRNCGLHLEWNFTVNVFLHIAPHVLFFTKTWGVGVVWDFFFPSRNSNLGFVLIDVK